MNVFNENRKLAANAKGLLIKQLNYLSPVCLEPMLSSMKSSLQVGSPGPRSAQVEAGSPLRPPSASRSPGSPPGMPDGGDGVAELAVDAATVIELLVGWPGRALVLDAADAADAHNEDDQHQDEGDAEGPDDDVQGVPGHVGETLRHVTRLPLEV